MGEYCGTELYSMDPIGTSLRSKSQVPMGPMEYKVLHGPQGYPVANFPKTNLIKKTILQTFEENAKLVVFLRKNIFVFMHPPFDLQIFV